MKKIKLACIVDDDPIFVFGIKKMMKLTEFCENFLVFANGQEALDSLTAIINKGGDIPQLILLDLNMPVMDGWEFLEEFTKTNPPKEITIYILTSSIDPRDLKRAKQFNRVSNYVIKPITIENLESIKNSLT
ncbi:response regulator [Leeuwenhoekiella sp. LLG6367-2.1]|uniref:Response regulator receiver domain-containing protein n=1 Tax=uncultured Flavobacteriia bacterium TaxID=212695 RepID=H6RHK9_9BACT|nr:transcriptional regulator [uncultured bacterium]CCG00520.1 response regulator receiver domain-containing protein [uncultured Flavobacteriia bacterium]